MSTKVVGFVILSIGCAFAYAAAKGQPPCCNEEAFFDYVDGHANSWSDYQWMLVKFTEGTVRKSNSGPLASLNDSDLHSVTDCLVSKMLADLQPRCPSFKEYVSYRYGMS